LHNFPLTVASEISWTQCNSSGSCFDKTRYWATEWQHQGTPCEQ